VQFVEFVAASGALPSPAPPFGRPPKATCSAGGDLLELDQLYFSKGTLDNWWEEMSQSSFRKPLFDLDAVFGVDDYLYFYSDSLTDERSNAEVALLMKMLELDSPMKILDLACGFGRHSNRLAALGHSVTGIDLMSDFLEIARKKAAEMGVRVDYRQGDMRQISFTEEFDRVISLYTSFGYFEDDENGLVMENMSRALKPGGLLLLDVPNRDVVVKGLPRSSVIDKNGDLMIDRVSFNALTGRSHNQRIVIRNGVRKDKPFSIRLYNATEIRDLLYKVGLDVCKVSADDGQPLSVGSRRIVVTARKPRQV
jgi:SAM-dependent methyltransferase